VQAAINAAVADLPSGMRTPTYQKANPNDDPVLAIALTSDTQSAELYNVADSLLAQRIRQIAAWPRSTSPAPRRRPCAWTSTCARSTRWA
jgi:hypothetical protein